MKHMTWNRAMIAFVLIYFPVATLGETGSYWRALQAFVFLAVVMALGAIEQCDIIVKRKQLSNALFSRGPSGPSAGSDS